MKPMEQQNATELYFNQVMEITKRLEEKMVKIEAVADMILMKSTMSHSLLVVRKVGEDKLEELKEIID